jgi:hypothetical protein
MYPKIKIGNVIRQEKTIAVKSGVVCRSKVLLILSIIPVMGFKNINIRNFWGMESTV